MELWNECEVKLMKIKVSGLGSALALGRGESPEDLQDTGRVPQKLAYVFGSDQL